MSKKAVNEVPSLAVAVVSGTIPDVMKALDAKMKEFEFIKDSKYKTSGNLEQFGNIKEEKLIPNLIRAYSKVLSMAVAYDNAAKDLGLTSYPIFEISNGSVEDWKSDILLRKAIIEQKETMDKLQLFRDKAAKFMSESDQKALFFAEIQSFLSETSTGQ